LYPKISFQLQHFPLSSAFSLIFLRLSACHMVFSLKNHSYNFMSTYYVELDELSAS
jgi:hypothetical protein